MTIRLSERVAIRPGWENTALALIDARTEHMRPADPSEPGMRWWGPSTSSLGGTINR